MQVGFADGNGGEVCQRIISKDTRIRKHHKASYILWVVGGWVVGGGRGEKSVSLNLLRSSRLHLLVPKGYPFPGFSLWIILFFVKQQTRYIRAKFSCFPMYLAYLSGFVVQVKCV